jgi:16S rRNA processing protein RimM
MERPDVFVVMGEITRAVGLKGEFRVSVTGNFDEGVFESPFLRLCKTDEGPGEPVRVRRLRWKGAVAIVSFENVFDRNGAEDLRGKYLGFESADYDAPEFPRGPQLAPFLFHGMEVVTTEGRELGIVDDYLVYPANGVLRVRDDEGTEFLVPVIEDVIDDVDRSEGRVRIHALPGLLDDES